MEWIEDTGRTVEDAKELALDRLGVVEAELEFEVVEEPKAGLFGRIGRTEARIRARVKPLSREKPGDRRRRRSQKGRPRREGSDRSNASSGPAGGRGGATATATKADDADDDEGRPARSGRNRSRRRGTGRGSGDNGEHGNDNSASVTAAEEESSVVDEVPIEEQATAAQAFTVGLIDAFGVGAQVQTEVRDDAVHVDIVGDELGLLVGPKGATLTALEEIVRAVVQRSTGGHSARVHVDVGGYRQRRRDALAEFARKLAAEVKDQGVERTLEPMTPPDRKVVHDAISEIEGVTTTSQGEEPRRRVVIRPG
jgi:spoIIIJ-associated protein